MEIVSKVHAKNLIKWAKDKPEVLVLSADLTGSTEIDLFKETYPERFLSMGIAEQNMMSFAGGLSREGFIPFVHTFAVFIYRRAYDQIAMSIAYPNLPVKMFGFLPGVTTPGGASHQAIEDIAVMRALPNMTVLECGDATEVESVPDVAYSIGGPVYIRMLRGEIPRLFKDPMSFGTIRTLSEGNDITLFSSGICTEEAIRGVKALEKHGLSIEHIHISTLKPFDSPLITALINKARYCVITMENHSIIGGLGTIIAEKMAEEGIGKKLVKIGLKDTFAHGGSRPYLMKIYEIDAMALINRVEKMVNASFGIKEEDLAEIYIPSVHSDAKVEAL